MQRSATACPHDTPNTNAPQPRHARRRTGAASGESAQSVFGASMVVSTVRCLLTYVVLPILGPVVGLGGAVGPGLGLALGAVSAVAIGVALRRFWAVGHRWRWAYTVIGAGVLVLLTAQAVGDLAVLLR